MGAGASIEDVGDLEREYESNVRAKLSPEQQSTLEAEFAANEGKGEFLIIGKCKRCYANFGFDDADPNFLPKPSRAAAAEEPAVVAAPEQPEPATGVERFALPQLLEKLASAKAAGLTALVLDGSADRKVDTFMGYGNNFRLLDAKQAALAVSVQRQPVETVLDGMRQKVVHAMRHGETLVVACQQSAPDFSGALSGETTFPLGLFENGGANYVNVSTEEEETTTTAPEKEKKGAATAALFRDADEGENSGIPVCKPEFAVVVTSHFASTDFEEFLFHATGLPNRAGFKVFELQL